MTKADRYLFVQIRFIAVELLGLAAAVLLMCLILLTESEIVFSQLTGRWETGTQRVVMKALPVFIIVMLLLLIRIFRKICFTSLFGSSAVLYQSLPVSSGTVITSKIFLPGICITVPGAVILPPLIHSMTNEVYYSLYGVTEIAMQILVNAGIEPEKTPAVLAMITLFLLLTGFTVSGAVLFAIIDCQRCRSGGRMLQLAELMVIGGSSAAVLTLPWFTVSWVDSAYPLLFPAVMLLWETMLLVGAGRGCVRRMER